jgi:hypothetical protein
MSVPVSLYGASLQSDVLERSVAIGLDFWTAEYKVSACFRPVKEGI